MCAVFRIILRSLNFLLTYDSLGNSIIVFGNVKLKLQTIESCSPSFIFSSGSNLKNDGSSTPSDVA